MDTDRNLLFGVLALQTDLIDPARFAEACSAWAARKDTPLADLLVQRGWLTAGERADVEKLFERKLKKHAGDVKASLAEAASDQVRRSLAGNADFDVSQSLADTTPPTPGVVLSSTTFNIPESRDRYTISRLHATGGIGRVWLARDGSIGRDVALKDLRPERADNAALWARFLKEAQVTGQLEHPGIVPIYEVGKMPDDQPFYTMRFIRGQTLAEASSSYHERRKRDEVRPLELRELLGAFVGVCNAVAYAHSRGVIHRDLKPQNVVLGGYGEVIVLDWGLAKVLGEAETEGEGEGDGLAAPVTLPGGRSRDETVAGQVMGTPAYMSPEQAEGRLDLLEPRTDVYGLGAILYEILSGQPPFVETQTTDMLRRVIHDKPIPPRAVVPTTPRALQAVCLKALAKRPADRYASAKELAAEVQRWLSDEPVSVFREPLPARFGRWARRHKSLVASAAVLLLALAVASTLGVFVVGHKNVQIAAKHTEVENARRREEAQRRLAQANFRKAREAVDKMLSRVGSERLRHVPMMEKLRRELLEEALTFNNDFLREQADDPELRHEAALAHGRLGKIYHQLRQEEAADKEERQASALLERLVNEFPDNLAYRRDLADAHSRRAQLAIEPKEIDRACRQALEIRRQLAAESPRDAASRVALADALLQLVKVTRVASQYKAAEEAAREALPIYRQLAAEFPDRRDVKSGLAKCLYILAMVLNDTGRSESVVESYKEALGLLKSLTAQQADNPDDRDDLAGVQRGLGLYYARTGRPADAETFFQESVACYERLATEFPFSPDYHERVAVGYLDLGVTRARAGKLAEAEPYFRKSVDRHVKLVRDFPRVTQYRRNVGFSQLNLARIQLDTGRTEDAAETLRQAVANRKRLVEDFPSVPDYRWDLSVTHDYLGRALQRLGQAGEAEKQFRSAVALAETVVGEVGSRLPDYRHKLAISRSSLAGFLRDVDRPKEAGPELQKAIATWEKLVAEAPKVNDYRRQLALAYAAQGGLRLSAEQLPEAEQDALRAVQVGEQLVKDFPEYRVCQGELGDSCRLLAEVRLRRKSLPEAEQALRRGLAIEEKLAAAEPRKPEPRAALAKSYKTLASIHALESSGGTAEQAEAARRKAVEALRTAVRWGHRDAAQLKADPDLTGLRQRDDFKKLITDLEAKQKSKNP